MSNLNTTHNLHNQNHSTNPSNQFNWGGTSLPASNTNQQLTVVNTTDKSKEEEEEDIKLQNLIRERIEQRKKSDDADLGLNLQRSKLTEIPPGNSISKSKKSERNKKRKKLSLGKIFQLLLHFASQNAIHFSTNNEEHKKKD